MASPVRISDKLIDEVAGKITDLYNKFAQEIEKQKPDVGDRIYDLLYGPYLSRMEQLPTAFFRKYDRIETRFVGEEILGYSFKLSSLKLVAYSHPPGDNVEVSDYRERVNIKRTPYTEDIIDAIVSWHKQKQDIYKVRNNATNSVRRVMCANKSLAPAIKAFPPLVDLLPAVIRLKVEVPQHRLSSVQMELDPHLKRLAADIALDKLINR